MTITDPLPPTDVQPGNISPSDISPSDISPSDVSPSDISPSDISPSDADLVPRPVAPDMPPRRRRLLLAVLWVVFALWVAALLAMYFVTVYPQRHPHDGRPGITIPPAR